ncbi:MAG: hypothetical protein BWY72_02551 [Bacteroidetes bacterium ADurb.Bin416]|nr:MAG: hypothetical protein BWY72_02551 [Bacteroidetes bacterium ADurb.Bin416]
MGLTIDNAHGDARPGHQAVRVEVSQFKPGLEQAFKADIKFGFRNQPLLNRINQSPVAAAAFQVGA